MVSRETFSFVQQQKSLSDLEGLFYLANKMLFHLAQE